MFVNTMLGVFVFLRLCQGLKFQGLALVSLVFVGSGFTFMYVYQHTYNVCVCVRVRAYVCMYVCIHIFIYVYDIARLGFLSSFFCVKGLV